MHVNIRKQVFDETFKSGKGSNASQMMWKKSTLTIL